MRRTVMSPGSPYLQEVRCSGGSSGMMPGANPMHASAAPLQALHTHGAAREAVRGQAECLICVHYRHDVKSKQNNLTKWWIYFDMG